MIRVSDIVLSLDSGEEDIKKAVSSKLKISSDMLRSMSIVKRAVDARKKNDIKFVYTVLADIGKDEKNVFNRLNSPKISLENESVYSVPNVKNDGNPPAIAGFGPAGMFAALILAQAGLCPVVIERGEDADSRMKSVKALRDFGILDPNSNVQFGEGGAGTFSDGKLNTGINDFRIKKVFQELVRFGAPKEILYEAKPHIGTDILPRIVVNLRKEILRLGGEVRFREQVINVFGKDGKVSCLEIKPDGKESYKMDCDYIVLAVGHSARDTFEMLKANKIPMIQKPFSVGMRIEHHQEMINRSQYGSFWNHPALGAADYKLSTHLEDGRGVYTFCMCPGGEVVCASSEEKTVVTNGMSEFKRNGKNANAAILVGVKSSDFGDDDPLAGVYFQRNIEKLAFEMGEGGYCAPAQRVGDFLKGIKTKSFSEISPSYKPGVMPSELSHGLPSELADDLRLGLMSFDGKIKGYAYPDAVLTGYETRSSSPVRVLREENMESSALCGLFPCGEGAGYAGGIVSAAVDGIKCAEKIIDKYR